MVVAWHYVRFPTVFHFTKLKFAFVRPWQQAWQEMRQMYRANFACYNISHFNRNSIFALPNIPST